MSSDTPRGGTGDARVLIEKAIRRFLQDVPALEPLTLVFGVDLHGRGDVQQFRVEMPAVAVTRDIGTDAKIRVEMRREFFNTAVDAGFGAEDWAESLQKGKWRATGIDQYLKLIANVTEKALERGRLQRARAHNG